MKNLSQNLSQRIVAYLMLFAFFALPLSAQNHIRVTGVVVDENDEPLPGANVVVVGHNNLGATTNLEGNFTLIRVPKNAMLSISFIGYQNKTAKVSDKPMRIKMSSDSKMLETVVVTALGISREAKSLGYARQSIDTESLLDTRDPNLLNSLNGKVAGVNIISNGGPLSSTRVEIRGNNSLTGNNQPLYVIDGVPIMNDMGESGDLDYGNAASSINPDDIENIEVLKGANAAALYGSDAANGVILITTRKASKKAGLGVSYGYNMQFTFLREYPALSGGESQRINLSTSLGSNLTGSLYILDEPSIGLHPRDTNRLIKVLRQLRDLGNTVIVVEHEEEVIRAADYIVDIGPKAGYNGGEVVFSGTLAQLLKNKKSLTADYLTGRRAIAPPAAERGWKFL